MIKSPPSKLKYCTSTVVSLSLEDWHNKGLTPDETKSAVNKVCGNYSASSTGINNNWQFVCFGRDPEDLVFRIEALLIKLLQSKAS